MRHPLLSIAMTHLLCIGLLSTAFGEGAEVKPGTTVVVADDGAEVTLGNRTVAKLSKGSQFKVTEVRGVWIGGSARVDGETFTGWLRRSQIAIDDSTSDPQHIDAYVAGHAVKTAQAVTKEGKTYPPGTKVYEMKADARSLSFDVPAAWNDRLGQTCSKYVETFQNVSELGKALGYSEGQAAGHAYWRNEKKEFQGVYFDLKNGSPGIQLVFWIEFVSGVGQMKFPPDMGLAYYTFRGTLYSVQPIVVNGKEWPIMSKVLRVDHKFIRTEEKTVENKRCLRADPVAQEIFPLGEALGYEKGKRVGPPFWAEWQEKDDYAKNPVAPYKRK